MVRIKPVGPAYSFNVFTSYTLLNHSCTISLESLPRHSKGTQKSHQSINRVGKVTLRFVVVVIFMDREKCSLS